MGQARRWYRNHWVAPLLIASMFANGCCCPQPGSSHFGPKKSCWDPKVPPPPLEMPRELAKVSLPEYVIEAPDILLIDAVKVVPKPPYRIESLDVLAIRVPDALPDRPIEGLYAVEPGGMVNLGPPY